MQAIRDTLRCKAIMPKMTAVNNVVDFRPQPMRKAGCPARIAAAAGTVAN